MKIDLKIFFLEKLKNFFYKILEKAAIRELHCLKLLSWSQRWNHGCGRLVEIPIGRGWCRAIINPSQTSPAKPLEIEKSLNGGGFPSGGPSNI